MLEHESEMTNSLYDYVIKNGIRRMYAYKEHELEGVDLKEQELLKQLKKN